MDGGSIDNTVSVAREIYPAVRIVQQRGRGKGSALRTGFEAATGDIIVMLDADGSTDPREIPAFVAALEAGADFAKGSRFLVGGGTTDMPAYRRMGNWTFIVLVRVLFGVRYTDLCYGYNAFWSRILPELKLNATGFEIETEMNLRVLRAGLNVTEVPSFEADRIHGTSNLRTIPDGWRVLKQIFRERFRNPSDAPAWPSSSNGVPAMADRYAIAESYSAAHTPRHENYSLSAGYAAAGAVDPLAAERVLIAEASSEQEPERSLSSAS